MTLWVRLHKHDVSESLRQAWVTVDKEVHSKLTDRAVETEYLISIPIVVGDHLRTNSDAVRNVIHVTTSNHRHARVTVWCADKPPVMITLDGYDASDWTKPFIAPFPPPS